MIIIRVALSILCIALLFVLLWIVVSILYSFTVTKKTYYKTKPLARILSFITCWGAFFFTRSKVQLIGKEMLPKDGKFVYVANHRSKFDPMVIMYRLAKYKIAFISKKENFQIPFFGKIIQKLCFLEINRNDPHLAMKTVEDAVKILKDGDASIGFYPEGTRSKDGKLQEFHNFMFRIPVMANVPIVVAVTEGTDEVAKKFPFPGGAKITIKIIDIIDTDFIKTHRPVEIGQKVYAMMKENLKQFS